MCDSYHCSLLGPTDPNRYHMWTGWVGNDGKGGGPVITNAEAGYDWTTYPERLEKAGVSWKVYQDIGLGLTAAGSWGWTSDPFIGNYGDNSLLYFHQYQNATPGNPLADRAKTGTEVNKLGRSPDQLLTDFRRDVENGTLPRVTWLVAPEAYTEHPNWEPHNGAWYVSQVIDILASNPAIWSKMALFVTYDEEGGFFDHLVPPTPDPARSTVSTVNEIYPGGDGHPAGPYGLGIRVPMIVVSPWTRGGWVNSQTFDHTSLIRFLERRFGVTEPNITPWRRAVAGDLTSAFDFRTPNRRPVDLPDTTRFKPADLTRQPDLVPVPPADPALPRQERGVRPARALPYALHADAVADTVELRNTGRATAVFQVRPAGADPLSITVGPGRHFAEKLTAGDVEVHGPNGFYRHFRRGTSAVQVRARYDEHRDTVLLEIRNAGRGRAEVTVADRYTGHAATLSLRPGTARTSQVTAARTRGWYDVTVTSGDTVAQYAGHLENGRDSITDPLMGGLV
ncbi:alkaline phosphatase family protein [Actinoplanes oblitus]|uniref:Alkaline phosphatase family protein n=1 Tax=Actinoplanes oblitus TaxID=3040509 RepID=A0ABY8W9C0_9ACTN|nr:alkaline phosphatase family protein [Actinoplanes oblitus]WIM94268.1 alkaline phosphatase family protein [Actinoplanes oblitus]